MAIKDWPASERPRERLLAAGPKTLSDAELLAVFLRTGTAGHSVLDLARDALDRCGGLRSLLSAPRATVEALPGFGPAKFAQLQAILELASRAVGEEIRRETLLNSPGRVRDYLRLSLSGLPHEVFMALFLDAQNRMIATEELFRGTLTQTSVYPREILKRALHHNAAAVILAHNHPSGRCRAEPRGRTADQGAARRAPAGRCAGARPHHRGRAPDPVVRRARPPVTANPCFPARAGRRRGALADVPGKPYTARLCVAGLPWPRKPNNNRTNQAAAPCRGG